MNKGSKYEVYARHVKEVCDVRGLVLFVYLDLLLLAIFLGYILFTQLHQWTVPIILSVQFLGISILLFNAFVKEKTDGSS